MTRLYVVGQAKVMVCGWENGKLEIRYRGRTVARNRIPAPIPARQVEPVQAAPLRNKALTANSDHPRSHNYGNMALWGTTGMPSAGALRVAADRFLYYRKGTLLMSVDKTTNFA
jgi:hypothetical protein